MTTKAWLEIQRSGGRIDRREVRAPKDEPFFGVASGECPNPDCKAHPFLVQGGNPEIMKDDRTLRSGGRCRACGDAVGYLYARPDTIFGLTEDRNVLSGLARVY